MRAMVLEKPGGPLRLTEVKHRSPKRGQVFLEIEACAVCRTDLHILDGELDQPSLPLIPGHQIVGRVRGVGPGAWRFREGDLVGVPWLGSTCEECHFCQTGRENLCREAEFTGYTLPGGYAELTVAQQDYCFLIPESYSPVRASPLLCAGLIGYRSLAHAGEARRVGIYGFGSAARIVTQVARHRNLEVFAFTRPGDEDSQATARRLGASWAGGSDERPPVPLEAAIIFAPAGELVPQALKALEPGGSVICGGIHMSDIPSFPYADLWEERSIQSIANLTRQDGEEFFEIAAEIPLEIEVETFPLEKAGEALERLRRGKLRGTAVLAIGGKAE